jgi:hypothetical protein
MENNDEKRKLIRSQFAMMVSDLPKQLGEGWQVTRYKNDTPWHAEVTHATLGGLSLSLDEWKARVHISGIFNDRVEGRQVWYKSSKEPSPSISVAVTREAKAVAGEVSRRLWPDYFRLREECEKRVAEYKKLTDDSRHTAEALAAIIGAPVRHNEGNYEYEVNVYGSRDLAEQSFDLKVSGDEVKFDHLRVPRATARAILKLLVEAKQEGRLS